MFLVWFKTSFFYRPTGAAAIYILNAAKSLFKKGKNDGSTKKKKIEKIAQVLNMPVPDLVNSKDDHDITKTCRGVVRTMYRDVAERRKMRFSYMAKPVRKAIRGK